MGKNQPIFTREYRDAPPALAVLNKPPENLSYPQTGSILPTMSKHQANLSWSRGDSGFGYKEFSRDHRWDFPSSGQSLKASSAPNYLGSEDCVDPEEAYVAALASCHMLTFLAVASMSGYVVDSYQDKALGELAANENKKMVISRVTLQPRVEFSGDQIPGAEELENLHQKAHRECFLANSVKTEVVWRNP